MKFLLIVLLIFPIWLFAQKTDVLQLSLKRARTSMSANGWIALDSGWKYKTGDNPDWAKPGSDDRSWQPINLFNHSVPPKDIPENSIVWFRLHFITDSTLLRPLAMRIYQTGPSQVFLDGKLLYNLGSVSSNADSIKLFSPNYKNLAFPIVNGREQVLAVRFANLQKHYPVFFNTKDLAFESWITPFENAESDYITSFNKTFTDRVNIAIGAAVTLSVLFFSLFVFFRADRINLYFGISVWFLVLLLIELQATASNHGTQFIPQILLNLFSTLFLSGMLICVYSIFNQKKGWGFRLLLIAGIVAIPLQFIFPVDNASNFFTLATIIGVIRVSSKHLQEQKTAGLILLTGFSIDLTYILISLFSSLGIVKMPELDALGPLALLTPSLSLAIYLGYSFGMTSQSLRKKLNEVEQLSMEKQQILSTQNEMLETQVKERTWALNQSLTELKSTQAQLIQSEKMASLGVLTAGIAHEIQNPLNFVNNFAEVNKELAEELKEELASNNDRNSNYQSALDIAADISANSDKIKHHGKRAEDIVKGMLEHSRSTSGQKQPADMNALAEECLRIGYESFRNKNPLFFAKLESDFDKNIGVVDIIPADIGRVLLNIYNNAFYAVNEKVKSNALSGSGYEPVISVNTQIVNDKIQITVSDNGVGIPREIVGKILQPFFTTKPTGQGTGLGLSLAYDIVKAHEGELKVNSVENNYTEFIIELPLK